MTASSASNFDLEYRAFGLIVGEVITESRGIASKTEAEETKTVNTSCLSNTGIMALTRSTFF